MTNLLKLMWALVLIGNCVIAYGAALRFGYLWAKERQALLLILGVLMFGIALGMTTWLWGQSLMPRDPKLIEALDPQIKAALRTYGVFIGTAWTMVSLPGLFLSAYAFGLTDPLWEGAKWITSRFRDRKSDSSIQ